MWWHLAVNRVVCASNSTWQEKKKEEPTKNKKLKYGWHQIQVLVTHNHNDMPTALRQYWSGKREKNKGGGGVLRAKCQIGTSVKLASTRHMINNFYLPQSDPIFLSSPHNKQFMMESGSGSLPTFSIYSRTVYIFWAVREKLAIIISPGPIITKALFIAAFRLQDMLCLPNQERWYAKCQLSWDMLLGFCILAE